eukprot:m.54500 g.54500  ORF g.54500 m.54500 type:complete len:247 (-) comp11085_c0_seq9:3202-3942(-)
MLQITRKWIYSKGCSDFMIDNNEGDEGFQTLIQTQLDRYKQNIGESVCPSWSAPLTELLPLFSSFPELKLKLIDYLGKGEGCILALPSFDFSDFGALEEIPGKYSHATHRVWKTTTQHGKKSFVLKNFSFADNMMKEAKALLSIKHPNIIQLAGVVRCDENNDEDKKIIGRESVYLVMPFIHPGSLQNWWIQEWGNNREKMSLLSSEVWSSPYKQNYFYFSSLRCWVTFSIVQLTHTHSIYMQFCE